MAAPVLQLRVPEDTLARLDGARGDDTRSAWVLRLIGRELGGLAPAAEAGTSTARGDSRGAPASLAALGDGEPSPGVLCMGPGCLDRSTSRYGLRRLPLCPACAAALQGQTYQRELPPGAERLIRRGAA